MAGSYQHCTNEDGSFIGEEFTGMIENLGDAWEACEMMHWMIGWLAKQDRTMIQAAGDAYYENVRKQGSGGT